MHANGAFRTDTEGTRSDQWGTQSFEAKENGLMFAHMRRRWMQGFQVSSQPLGFVWYKSDTEKKDPQIMVQKRSTRLFSQRLHCMRGRGGKAKAAGAARKEIQQ